MEVFYILNHWHWWAMAALWIIAEFLAPSRYFLGLGIASFITGVIVLLAPSLDGRIQLGIFILLTVAALWQAHRSLQRRRPVEQQTKDKQP